MIEIHRWKRRNLLLTSIIEQLKTKESKAVITTLIANKSKHLKKWRSVDITITDTANEAKDKYKYLEGLKRHIEPLCEETRISEVMNTCLHHLMMGFKQVGVRWSFRVMFGTKLLSEKMQFQFSLVYLNLPKLVLTPFAVRTYTKLSPLLC
jgi:hypothetical protein